jgi:hypothetical protein
MIPSYYSLSLTTARFLVSLPLASSASANCYDPNGNNRNGYITGTAAPYQPCNPGDLASMCCSVAFNECRSDGLCFDGTTLWRESCTDPTWQSPSCIKLCVNGTGMNLNFLFHRKFRFGSVDVANQSLMQMKQVLP